MGEMGFWSGVFIGWATSGLGLLVFLALTSKACRHDWENDLQQDALYRECSKCKRLEKFEPDVGGNTAGHWDRVT